MREAGGNALFAAGRILSAVKGAGLFYRLRTLFFRIIKILQVLWLSLIRYPIVQTSSVEVQFVEQDEFYKLCPATAGLKACCQLTGQQWVATMGINLPIDMKA